MHSKKRQLEIESRCYTKPNRVRFNRPLLCRKRVYYLKIADKQFVCTSIFLFGRLRCNALTMPCLYDKHITLAKELRDAFTTTSVINAEREMELRYIGYSNKRLKILDVDVLERYGSEFKRN